MLRSTAWFCGLMFALGTTAHASVLVLDIVPDIFNEINTGAWSLGWSFTVNSPVTVTSLDFFDAGGSGLAASHDVGIYNSDESLVVSATVLPSDPLDGTAPWNEHAVDPTLLVPGLYYIAAETGSAIYAWTPSSITINPQITYIQDQYAASAALAFPSESIGYTGGANGYGIFGPSFDITSETAAPEPSTLALLAAGLVMAGLARRSKAVHR